MKNFKYIKRFSQLGIDDVAIVGGKNASLGEMYQALSSKGVRVPNGFASTADAYNDFISHNGLYDKISVALQSLNIQDTEALAATGAKIRRRTGSHSHGGLPDPVPGTGWRCQLYRQPQPKQLPGDQVQSLLGRTCPSRNNR